MKRCIFAVLCILTMMGCLSGEAGAFALVRNGQPACFIVIAHDAGPAERFAADELAEHIGMITGAVIPVRVMGYDEIPATGKAVLIGRGDWLNEERFGESKGEMEMLGDQGFVIRSFSDEEPEVLLVAGRAPRGTIYAVTELLRIIGVRWFTPEITRYPTTRSIDPGDISLGDLPCFDIRDAGLCVSDTSSLWRSRLRLNTGYGYQESELGCTPVYVPMEVPLSEMIPAEMFDDVPEMFAMRDGIRTTDTETRCLSNPETAFAAAESLIARIERTPHITSVTITFDDSTSTCTCPECSRIREKEHGESGLAVMWANRVARILANVRSDATVGLAMSGIYEQPPLTEVPSDNVLILLSPDDADQRMFYEESIDIRTMNFVGNLRGWRKLNARVIIDHPTGNHLIPLAPFPDFSQLFRNIEMYHYEFAEGCLLQCAGEPGLPVAQAELRTWVFSELLWNRYTDGESLVRDWTRGVYGNAHGAMEDYHKHVQEIAENINTRLTVGTHPIDYISEEWTSEAERMLQRAYALSLTDSVARRYVKRERFGLRYIRFLRLLTAPPGRNARERYLSLLDTWLEDADELGIERIDEDATCREFADRLRRVLK